MQSIECLQRYQVPWRKDIPQARKPGSSRNRRKEEVRIVTQKTGIRETVERWHLSNLERGAFLTETLSSIQGVWQSLLLPDFPSLQGSVGCESPFNKKRYPWSQPVLHLCLGDLNLVSYSPVTRNLQSDPENIL